MRTPVDTALDNLTRIVQVVRNDPKLRRWFDTLGEMSVPERRNAIVVMSLKMTALGENADLITALRLLADEQIFEAACLAVRA